MVYINLWTGVLFELAMVVSAVYLGVAQRHTRQDPAPHEIDQSLSGMEG